MSRLLTGACLGLLAAAVGCDSRPSATQPSRADALTLSAQSATLARGAALQVTASAQLRGGRTEDVTQSATWTSSNPGVVAVSSGRLTIVGLGAALVTASYQDRSATLSVTGRRRTALQGSLRFRDANRDPSITAFDLYIDGVHVYGIGGWGTPLEPFKAVEPPGIHDAGFDVEAGGDGRNIEPGNHEISVAVTLRSGAHEIISLAGNVFRIVDLDTDTGPPSAPEKYRREVLRIDSLQEQRATLTSGQRFTWSIQVPTYTQ